MSERDTKALAAAIAEDVKAKHWFAHGQTPLGSSDFWQPKSLVDKGVLGRTANFDDRVVVADGDYLAMRERPLVSVGIWSFVTPGPDVADIRYAHRHPSAAGATLYRLREENGELRAKVERLELLLGMKEAMDQIDAAMQEEDG